MPVRIGSGASHLVKHLSISLLEVLLREVFEHLLTCTHDLGGEPVGVSTLLELLEDTLDVVLQLGSNRAVQKDEIFKANGAFEVLLLGNSEDFISGREFCEISLQIVIALLDR